MQGDIYSVCPQGYAHAQHILHQMFPHPGMLQLHRVAGVSCQHLLHDAQIEVEGMAMGRMQGHKQGVDSMVPVRIPAFESAARLNDWLQCEEETIEEEQSENMEEDTATSSATWHLLAMFCTGY